MHDVKIVTMLFSLADKCAIAAEGHAWHSTPQTGVTQTGGSGAATQGGGKKKKNHGHDRPQSGAPVAATAARGREERDKRPRQQGSNSRHNASEYRKILKLAKRISERREQASKDGSPPRRRPGKEKVDEGGAAAGERYLGYQSPEQVLKDILTGDSNSGDDNDRCKKLYVMYGESWELTSRTNVKSLRREVLSTIPGVPKAAPHQRLRSTTITFGASDCPENKAGASILPLITAPVIANMKLHHVLIDGGAGLNVISHAAFKQLQIPGSRLGPSRPFSGVGPQLVYPLGSIALPVIFGTEENFRTENVQFDVAEVNLPFNAIIGTPALYRFMAIAHYGYLVLKMSSLLGSSPCGATAPLRLQLWRSCTLWRQKPLARMTGEGPPRLPIPRRLPRCLRCNHLEQMAVPSRPSRSVWIPPRPPASRVIWRRNRNPCSSPSSRQMPTYSHGNHRRCLGSPGR
jgi:hypothetical protein